MRVPGDMLRTVQTKKGCLSTWHISLLACGDANVDDVQGHLNTCEECTSRLQMETAQVRAAAYESIPPNLRKYTPRPRLSIAWLWTAMSTAAVACLAVVLVNTQAADTQPGFRAKGGESSLSATVSRGSAIVLDDKPLENVRLLHGGDRLRLRLAGTVAPWVRLQGFEDGHWETYYQGAPPADRWLPIAVELTDQGDTRLRLVSCDATPPHPEGSDVPQGCQERIFGL